MKNSFSVLTAEEAVAYIEDGDTVAFSGFTPAGSAKVVPRALAKRALDEHARERRYKLRVLTGASTGREIDEDLARAGHIRHDLMRCFELHRNLMEYGSMLPD